AEVRSAHSKYTTDLAQNQRSRHIAQQAAKASSIERHATLTQRHPKEKAAFETLKQRRAAGIETRHQRETQRLAERQQVEREALECSYKDAIAGLETRWHDGLARIQKPAEKRAKDAAPDWDRTD